jgi:hypothetical protein
VRKRESPTVKSRPLSYRLQASQAPSRMGSGP